MYIFLNSLFIVARSDESESFLKVIFVVLIAAFWAVMSIYKSMKSAKQQKNEQFSESDVVNLPKHRMPRKVSIPDIYKASKTTNFKNTTQQINEQLPKNIIEQSFSDSLQTHEGNALKQSLFDCDNSEEVQKAIIYLEVIGKPVSLRQCKLF